MAKFSCEKERSREGKKILTALEFIGELIAGNSN